MSDQTEEPRPAWPTRPSDYRAFWVKTCDALGVAIRELEALRADNRRLREALAEYRMWLEWALDLMDMYELRLLEFGDPPERVYSAIHVAAKATARNVLIEEVS